MDPQEAQEILACDTPAQAKKLGRKIKNLRPDWDDVKYDIMASFVAYKFLPDDDLKAQLVATGDAELIEGNYWGDTYWGVCRGKGENNLGKILMNLRAEIVKGMGKEWEMNNLSDLRNILFFMYHLKAETPYAMWGSMHIEDAYNSLLSLLGVNKEEFEKAAKETMKGNIDYNV